MKRLLMTSGERFDIQSVRPAIEEIVAAFGHYLDEYPVKTAKSMHALLGPVPMLLDGARLRKESVETLIGRAVRAHEMNDKTHGYLSPEALKALESGTAKLLDLCKSVPVTTIGKVTERIRYSLYYARRKKSVEWLETTRMEFSKFLQKKYGESSALAKAWNESNVTIESVRFPSKRNEAYTKANDAKKADIDAFVAQPVAKALLVMEEDDNE